MTQVYTNTWNNFYNNLPISKWTKPNAGEIFTNDKNWPFAAEGHMVQYAPNWNAE